MVLANAPLHYPSAREWMWNYCIYLGPWTAPNGDNLDLGIYLYENRGPSLACVYGNEPGDYLSGSISFYDKDDPMLQEVVRRATELNLL